MNLLSNRNWKSFYVLIVLVMCAFIFFASFGTQPTTEVTKFVLLPSSNTSPPQTVSKTECSNCEWEQHLSIGNVNLLVEGGNNGIIVRSAFLNRNSSSGVSFFIFVERHRDWEHRSLFCALNGRNPVKAELYFNSNTEWIITQPSVQWVKVRLGCKFKPLLSLPSNLYLLISKANESSPFTSFTSQLDFFTLPIKVTYSPAVHKKKKLGLCSGVWRKMKPWFFAEIPTQEFARMWFEYHFSIGVSVIMIYFTPLTVQQWLLDLIREISSPEREVRLLPWKQIAYSEYMDMSSQVWAFSKDTAYADCLFRSRNEFEWLTFLDMDEFLAVNPDASSISNGLLQQFEIPDISAVRIYWFIFYPECEDQGEEVVPLWKRFPWYDPAHRNTKFIVKPKMCNDVGCHQPFDCVTQMPIIQSNYTIAAHTTYQKVFPRAKKIREECKRDTNKRDPSLVTKENPWQKSFVKKWRHEIYEQA